MDLETRSEKQGDVLVLQLMGELTGPSTGEFKAWAKQEVEDFSGSVRVDCERLHFIDSAGLGSLIFLRKCVIENGAELQLTEVSGWLRKFLQVTGLEETFCGESTPEDAS